MSNRVRRGFTLPEVLVTVTVVAVLAAVVVPAVTQYVNRGNNPATQTDITQIQNAVNGYVADNRTFPTHLTDLTAATGHGPYFSGSVVGQTGSTGATAAAFTSGGINVTFADSLHNGNDGFLTLFVATTTPCARLLALDTLYDGANSSNLGNGAGRVTWTNSGSPCAQATPTGTFTNAKFQFMTIGS